ncbi:hypothetical protein ABIB40_000848 [Pedobacter sp. UYP30]|uniref:hypothetical protein n=1 Tax=Pedobacter sp. UYP30 TaxID=1756400 RepID=UPI003392E6F8
MKNTKADSQHYSKEELKNLKINLSSNMCFTGFYCIMEVLLWLLIISIFLDRTSSDGWTVFSVLFLVVGLLMFVAATIYHFKKFFRQMSLFRELIRLSRNN